MLIDKRRELVREISKHVGGDEIEMRVFFWDTMVEVLRELFVFVERIDLFTVDYCIKDALLRNKELCDRIIRERKLRNHEQTKDLLRFLLMDCFNSERINVFERDCGFQEGLEGSRIDEHTCLEGKNNEERGVCLEN